MSYLFVISKWDDEDSNVVVGSNSSSCKVVKKVLMIVI